MAQSLVRLPAPIHQVREKLQRLLRKPLATVFENTDDALFELADKATNNQEQNLYFESMREVRLRRRKLEQSFWSRIDQGFTSLLCSNQDESSLDDLSGSMDDLTLVEHEELERQVAVEAMAAKALEASADTVQQISLRFSALVPAKVYVSNNPVGPEALCKAFSAEVDPLDIDIKAQLVLLKLFDKHVLVHCAKVMTILNQVLIEHNVLPSLTSSRQKNKRQGAAHQTAMGSAQTPYMGNSVGAGQVGDANSQVLDQLRGLLGAANNTVASAVPGGVGNSPVASIPLSDLLGVLGHIQHRQDWGHSPQEVLLKPQQLQGLIEGNLSQQGMQKLRAVDQDVINLVNMLFEFILEDRNLPVPMKALLARLQIPMLKVAIADKSFFNKGTHPARRLLNELATAALGWQEPELKDNAKNGEQRKDPLYRQVESTITRLLENFETDMGIFDELLTEFLAFIDKERRRASILERRTLDAEDGKAKAEAARAKVDEAMTEKVGGMVLPEVVGELLQGPWSNVLFLVCLKQGKDSEEWDNAIAVVDDLLWSVTVQVGAQERTRLIKLLPDLLQRLRKGLEQISYNPFEMTKLLKRLEKVHLLQIKGMQQQSPEKVDVKPVADKPAKAIVKEKAVNHQGDTLTELSRPSNTPALSTETKPVEVKAEETVSTKAAAPISHTPKQQPREAEVHIDDKYLRQVDKLTQGCWFEMSESEDNRYRCRLAAIIKSVDKYIFVNRNGMKVAEKGHTELAQALQSGKLRQLDDGMLFDRALESVIGNLRQAKAGL
ncbi:DUF1631 domain-containing protein [Maricurvus nonylphenolicus]|uniref:DUF1631 domain-containing protein n=1 Tax=Maricurvus nonylphenolicus TaxID=1008307 RepID=UPI0036F3C871